MESNVWELTDKPRKTGLSSDKKLPLNRKVRSFWTAKNGPLLAAKMWAKKIFFAACFQCRQTAVIVGDFSASVDFFNLAVPGICVGNRTASSWCVSLLLSALFPVIWHMERYTIFIILTNSSWLKLRVKDCSKIDNVLPLYLSGLKWPFLSSVLKAIPVYTYLKH